MRGFCDQCGKPIAAKRFVKYCSDACKMKAYRRRHDAQVGTPARNHERVKNAVRTKANTTVKDVCQQCGLDIYRNGNQALQLYCSDACKQKAYRARKKEIVGVWSVGDECLTDIGRKAVIKSIDGTRYARIDQLVGDKWLPGLISLKKLRPLVDSPALPTSALDVPPLPLFKVGDIVEVNKPNSPMHEHTGRIKAPFYLPNRQTNGNFWVEFEALEGDDRIYSGDFAPDELTLVTSIEAQDAKFDSLLRSFGWK